MSVKRKLGIWGVNGGNNPDLDKMLSFAASITTPYDYMSANGVAEFRRRNPDGIIVVRFFHPHNWQSNIEATARDYAAEILQKLPEVDNIGAYWYFWNELNLYNENDKAFGQQWECETPEFYRDVARWTQIVAETVKTARPNTKVIMPPFASGHKEDGAWDNGEKKDGFAGYDFFKEMIPDIFENIICWHGYWGDGNGTIPARLYDPELSTWYAMRWQRVLDLFAVDYGNTDVKIIIDECGGMDTTNPTFPDDMIYFGEKTLTNPQVIAVTPFLWADNFNSPSNSMNDWQRIPNLDDFVRRLEVMPEWKANDSGNTLPPSNGGNSMLFKDFDSNVLNENLRRHAVDSNGKVTGSVARIIAADTAEQHWGNHNPINKGDKYWRVKYATLIDEESAKGGQNINVSFVDENGAPYLGAVCWFAYPSSALSRNNWVGAFDNGASRNGDAFTYPTGQGQIAQGKNNFSPEIGSEELGPYIVGGLGGYHSEVIAGFGMPNSRHVEYAVIFELATWADDNGGTPPSPTPPPVTPPPASQGFWCALLDFLKGWICK